MENKDRLIISTYEKLKQEMKEQEISDIDQVWAEFLNKINQWPSQKAQIVDCCFSVDMEKIAGIGSGGKTTRKNFDQFLTDVSQTNCRNEYQSIASIYTVDMHKFNKDIEEHSIEGIISLSIMFSQLSADRSFEKLPYIDVLFSVLWDRMCNYPNYLQSDRPKALTKRFINSIFQKSFTTIVDENKLSDAALKLGIEPKSSYVTKQMYIRKAVNNCLHKHYPAEKSQFIQAALAWWMVK